MRKQGLKQISAYVPTARMRNEATRDKGIRYFYAARKVLDGSILEISFFKRENIADGVDKPCFRTFFEKGFDYISLDENDNWKTASIEGNSNYYFFGSWWDNSRMPVSADDNSESEIRSWFKEYDSEDTHPLRVVARAQDVIKTERTAKKNASIINAIDREMAVFKNPPAKFTKWATSTVMEFSQYLFYTPAGKNADVECSSCGNMYTASRKNTVIKPGSRIACNICGAVGTCVPKSRKKGYWQDERWCLYLDRLADDRLSFRYFLVTREYRKDGIMPKETIKEQCRSTFSSSDDYKVAEDYEYVYHSGKGYRWRKGSDKVRCGIAVLYPDNIQKALKDTAFQYAGLDVIAANRGVTPEAYQPYAYRYRVHPVFEHILKMGMINLVFSISYEWHFKDTINESGKTIFEKLKLTKVNTRLLSEINGDLDDLKNLQSASANGIEPAKEEYLEMAKVLGSRLGNLYSMNRYGQTIQRCFKWMVKEGEIYNGDRHYFYNKNKVLDVFEDWKNYLGWCEQTGKDMTDRSVLLPKGFKTAHDYVYGEYVALQNEIAAKKKAQDYENAKKEMANEQILITDILNGNKSFNEKLESCGLRIVSPKTADDLVRESDKLHHCVKTYIPEVARGETMIVFIRKAEDVKIPYYTLEWKKGKMIQCRGKGNCGMTDEVKTIADAFTDEMEKAMLNGTVKKLMPAVA